MSESVASEKRIELLDLLAQGERHVEALAKEANISVANASQHLQVLRSARLVETEKAGVYLLQTEKGKASQSWACYHTVLYEFECGGEKLGIIGCAVGGSFAVLLAEQLFVSGCELLISITSAGQILPVRTPPYFVLIDRALRDEGTSYHYLPPSRYSVLIPEVGKRVDDAFCFSPPVTRGAAWTTDAPYRETEAAIESARAAARIVKPSGAVHVIHWRHEAAIPRGPSLEIRPRPEQIVEWATHNGLLEIHDSVLDLPPWHYGFRFQRVRRLPSARCA